MAAGGQKPHREDNLWLKDENQRPWSSWKCILKPGDARRPWDTRIPRTKEYLKRAFPPKNYDCGIYEFKVVQERKKTMVVYIGSTCRCKLGSLHERINEYCSNGSHKRELLEEALRKNYKVHVRVRVRPNSRNTKKTAEKDENELLHMYDYAWNQRLNGGQNGLRDVL